jgi:uridine phosphorylase
LSSAELLSKLESRYPKGVTVTAPGFYAPQGRVLRAPSMIHDFLDHLRKFQHPHYRLTNFEMETAGIYGMGKVFGHHCLSVNAILANRANNTFSSEPEKVVARMIEEVLEVLTTH